MSWKQLDSEEIVKVGIFRMRKDKCELPDGRIMPNYYVVEYTDWVHVIPLTRDGKVVLVDQYRYPPDKNFIEIPGGALDKKSDRDPRDTAIRELQEETGYVPGEIIHLGSHYPNPAIQANRLHTYLAFDCELKESQNLDPFEDLEVRLMPVEEFVHKLFNENNHHALMVASVAQALPHLRQRQILS